MGTASQVTPGCVMTDHTLRSAFVFFTSVFLFILAWLYAIKPTNEMQYPAWITISQREEGGNSKNKNNKSFEIYTERCMCGYME
jgi:hypothetical protein